MALPAPATAAASGPLGGGGSMNAHAGGKELLSIPNKSTGLLAMHEGCPAAGGFKIWFRIPKLHCNTRWQTCTIGEFGGMGSVLGYVQTEAVGLGLQLWPSWSRILAWARALPQLTY